MGYFQTEQWIPVELPRVFAFFWDPNNLPRIMPEELQALGLSIELVRPPGLQAYPPAAGVGTTISFSFRPIPFVPLRQRWIAQIVKFESGARFATFTDQQLRGPFKSWTHDHEFESETRDGRPGTLIRDRVEFEVGYGPVGQAIDKWITERMSSTFGHRQAALEQLLKSG